MADSYIAMVLVTAEGSPVPDNPAIARCYSAWRQRYDAELAAGEQQGFAAYVADTAYRNAMPALADHQGISDFIACTAHGMLNGAIQCQNGTQLLYAAQIALSTLRYQPPKEKVPGRPKMLTK